MKKPYVYIAGPYTSDRKEIQRMRGHLHCKYTATLLKDGNLVYSPIAETMNLAEYGNIDGTWDTWREKDLRQLDAHDELWILMLDGWQESKGVRGEVKYWLQHYPSKYIKLVDFYETRDMKGYITSLVSTEVLFRYFNVKTVEELND